jgi:hypothetical protein
MKMREKRIQDPALAYTAHRLGDYARGHGVDTERIKLPSTPNAIDTGHVGPQALRHGHALPMDFEVANAVPRTIPVVIARLAMFDARMRQPQPGFPRDMYERLGVYHDSVRWLRLALVEPDDSRVGEILSIVGARPESDFSGVEPDSRDNPTPYTKHYYMESNQYAVKIARYAPERHLGLLVTGIEFMLPDKTEQQNAL